MLRKEFCNTIGTKRTFKVLRRRSDVEGRADMARTLPEGDPRYATDFLPRMDVSDPQIVERKLKIDMPHPTAGTVPLVSSPIRMSETPVEYRSPPPLLGEHTLAVLEQMLGLSRDDISTLAGMNIVQARGLR